MFLYIVEQKFTHFVCQWMLWSQLWSEGVSRQLQIKVKIQPCIQYFRNVNHNLQQIIPATSPLVQLGFSLPAIEWKESNLRKHPCTVGKNKTTYLLGRNQWKLRRYIDIGSFNIPGQFSKLSSSPWHLRSDLYHIKCRENSNFEMFNRLDILIVTTFPRMMSDTNLQNSSPCSAIP